MPAALDKPKRDARKLERTTVPGVYRRHAENCKRPRVCGCPYVVVWKAGGKQHKQMFAKMEEAREHKRGIGPGQASRQPLSKETVAGYYEGWIDGYRGRTTRGVQDSTTRAYRISFEHPHPAVADRANQAARPDTPRGPGLVRGAGAAQRLPGHDQTREDRSARHARVRPRRRRDPVQPGG